MPISSATVSKDAYAYNQEKIKAYDPGVIKLTTSDANVDYAKIRQSKAETEFFDTAIWPGNKATLMKDSVCSKEWDKQFKKPFCQKNPTHSDCSS